MRATAQPKRERLVVPMHGIPAWMPERQADALRSRGFVGFRFSDAERAVFTKPEWLEPSEWAERYRVLRMSSLPGKWKNVFTPYLKGIMDAARHEGVETVILCKTPQTGGSEAGMNLLGHMIEYAPGPAMVVFPDEVTARENAQDRLLPMLRDSKRLRRYLSGSQNDSSSIRINLRHMPVYLGWSGSVSRLGNKPIRILILDELDKYQNPKKEATSEQLAEKRTTTWKSKRFIFKISTPTTEGGPIWTAYTQEAGARFEYRVVCPDCGTVDLMDPENIEYPMPGEGLPDPEEVLQKRLAKYRCPHCGALWTDADRDKAVRSGYWTDDVSGTELFAYLRAHRPRKIGFHLPAWLSYFVSLSEVAWAMLRYRRSGSVEDLRLWKNQYAAEPWVPKASDRAEDAILALCDDRPRGIVPGPLPETPDVPRCAALLAGVDTQKGYFRYVIRAFGFGESEESWLVQCGALQSFGDLERVLIDAAYHDADGREYKVSGIMIDAMGNRTSEVYAWATKHRGMVFPWQGKKRMSSPYNISALEFFPSASGRKVRIPGGLSLYQVDTTFFKSALAGKLEVNAEDPGAFRLHTNEGGGLAQYAAEMCAEVWDDKTQGWVNPSGKANHFWDCEVMASALAYIRGVRSMRVPDAGTGKAHDAPRKPAVQGPARRIGGRRY